MAMGTASIGQLTMMVSLLLVAAAAAGNSVVSGGTTIRLPSDDARGVAADLVRATARAKLVGDKKRPWECCDHASCINPPICHCLDLVVKCSDACNYCVEAVGWQQMCMDEYRGDPGPKCHDWSGGSGSPEAAVSSDVQMLD